MIHYRRKKKRNFIFRLIRSKIRNVYLRNSTVSLYLFIKILYQKLAAFDIDQRAAAVSYSFILAIFPGTLFLFTLIPYIPILGINILIMDMLQNVLPSSLFGNIENTMNEILSQPRFDILSLGFIFSGYAATNGMTSLMRAFNLTIKKRDKRSFFKSRWVAFLLTLSLVLALLSAIIVLVIGQFTLDYLNESKILENNITLLIINMLSYTSVFFLFYFSIASMYHFGPEVSKKFSFFNFGALFASLLCILATQLFSYYFENFNSYNRLYGSIGTFIAFMVWIYLISLIIILGFEVNHSYRLALQRTKKIPGQI